MKTRRKVLHVRGKWRWQALAVPHIAGTLSLPVAGWALNEFAAANALALRFVVTVIFAHLRATGGGRADRALAAIVITEVVAVRPIPSDVNARHRLRGITRVARAAETLAMREARADADVARRAGQTLVLLLTRERVFGRLENECYIGGGVV